MTPIALDTGAIADALAARTAANRPLAQAFFVGCGASLADLYPARYLLAGEAARLRADSITANEFAHATPRALGAQSVVVLCSHSGGTAEVVAAAKLARDAGALTIALTNNASAAIAEHADHTVLYHWGDDARVADNPMAIALSLGAEILRQAEGDAHYQPMRDALGRIDGIVTAAREQVRPQAEAFANAYDDERMCYILSSGASYAHAYAFAICSLMEMQWLHASAIHSGEFFHGPFEITDRDTRFIVLQNEGRTRPLDERVIDFLDAHAGRHEVLDARALGLGALPATVVEYFNPVLFYSVLSEYRAALAAARGHPLDRRRYMGKVAY
jgi:fructoselysine-6-P-deglycase FrlB-like protein